MNFQDLLCDRCLYLVETSEDGVTVADFCKRCQKKLLENLLEIATEMVDGLPEEQES